MPWKENRFGVLSIIFGVLPYIITIIYIISCHYSAAPMSGISSTTLQFHFIDIIAGASLYSWVLSPPLGIWLALLGLIEKEKVRILAMIGLSLALLNLAIMGTAWWLIQQSPIYD